VEFQFGWLVVAAVLVLVSVFAHLVSRRFGAPILLVFLLLGMLAGEDGPVAIHGVHHVFHPPVRLAAWPDPDRRSRIVFITRDLPGAAIRRRWAAAD